MNSAILTDFYKFGHVSQYHKDVRQVFSTWTARYTRVPDCTHTTHFGLNYFLKKYIRDEFHENFFDRRWEYVREEYTEFVQNTLFKPAPYTDHLKELHAHGRMPLTFYSLPEGSQVPHGVPSMVIKNTEPGKFFWVTNWIETLMSSVLWKPTTSATTARQFRKLFLQHARASGETDFGFVDWQGHDFSMRGMSGLEDAVLSGMGHLLSFTGTDTAPAIQALIDYYGASFADGIIGGSVDATEHSVMCAGQQDGEYDTFKRLLTESSPSGVLSVVSDTWDLWRVLTKYIPQLQAEGILDNRDGKLVIRPDSGDPVEIMIGKPGAAHGDPRAYGAVSLLAQAMGTHARGGKLDLIGKPHPMFLNTGAVIYGDGISLDRADRILKGVTDKGLSPYNCVFGIGSYTYEMVTRDTHGMAMKATAYKNAAGEIVPMFKKPVTDDGGKFSHRGITTVFWDLGINDYIACQGREEKELDNCAFEKVFEDGALLVNPTLTQIRERVRAGL